MRRDKRGRKNVEWCKVMEGHEGRMWKLENDDRKRKKRERGECMKNWLKKKVRKERHEARNP